MVCAPHFWVKSSAGGALRVIAGEPGNHTESARGASIVFGFELYLNCISTRFVWRAGWCLVESIGEIFEEDVVTGGNITGNGQLHHQSSKFLDFWMERLFFWMKIYEINFC